MRGPLILHQTIEYKENESFIIRKATKEGANHTYIKNSHWHEELEIAYILSGRSQHYIEGECIDAEPGRLVVTNCECIHRISVDQENCQSEDDAAALILLIPKAFLEAQFPEYKSLWFLNEKPKARREIQEIMLRLSEYHRQNGTPPHEELYIRGLILLLLHYMCEEGHGKAGRGYAQRGRGATEIHSPLY